MIANNDPFVKFDLKDESIETPVEAGITLQFSYLQPYFSGRGRDNVIIRDTLAGTFQARIGSDYDSVSKYGHGALVANQVLRGGGILDSCRLMPADAKKASLVVGVAIRAKTGITVYQRDSRNNFILDANGDKVPVDPAETVDGFEIMTYAKVGDLTGDNSVIGTLAASDAGDDWATYPLMLVSYQGRGVCGNDFGIGISRDAARDGKFADGRRYIMEFIEVTPSGTIKTLGSTRESLSFALNPEALLTPGATTLDSLDVNFESYQKDYDIPMDIEYYYENYYSLINALDSAFAADIYSLDVLFGVDAKGVGYDAIVLGDDHLDLSESNVRLLGGNDGSLGIGNEVSDGEGGTTTVDAAHKTATMEALLQSFYRGEIDEDLFDKRLVDAGITFDAWWSLNVKKTMAGEFGQVRDDIFRYIDCGDVTTQTAAEAVAASINESVSGEDGYMVGVVIQSGKTKDRSRNLRTSGCYEIARALPTLYSQRTPFTVHAGWKSGRVKYMTFDFLPKIIADNLEIGPLQDANLIFAMKLGREEDTVCWMSDDTQYSVNYSVLGSVRNAIHSGEVKRTVSKVLIKYNFHPEDAEAAMREASDELTDLFADTSFFPSSIPIQFELYQTKNDVLNEVASADVYVGYPNVINGWNVTIHIQRASQMSA